MTEPNLVDGSVLCYEVSKYGALVTVLGNDPTAPVILQFDEQDINALRGVVETYDMAVSE